VLDEGRIAVRGAPLAPARFQDLVQLVRTDL
jgi:hypothetical protein